MAEAALSVTRRGGAIRLTLPARVANDLGALQKGLKSLAERLGHPQCATGCDILHFTLEREFTLTDAVALNPQDPEVIYRQATVLAINGKTGPALTALREALQRGYSPIQAEKDEDLAALRTVPAFQELLRKQQQSGGEKR